MIEIICLLVTILGIFKHVSTCLRSSGKLCIHLSWISACKTMIPHLLLEILVNNQSGNLIGKKQGKKRTYLPALWCSNYHYCTTSFSKLRFCTSSNPVHGMSDICDGENLWNPQKEFIINISIHNGLIFKSLILVLFAAWLKWYLRNFGHMHEYENYLKFNACHWNWQWKNKQKLIRLLRKLLKIIYIFFI